MPHDYYDDEGDNPGSMTEKEPSEKDGMQPESALVPKSFFAGKKDLEVGDVETVKILRIMDDEVEILCLKENYDDEREEETEEEDAVLASEDMMSE